LTPIETNQTVSKDGTGPAPAILALALRRLLNDRYGFSQAEAHRLVQKNPHLLTRIAQEISR
jgi:hypothetical protein